MTPIIYHAATSTEVDTFFPFSPFLDDDDDDDDDDNDESMPNPFRFEYFNNLPGTR